MKKKAKRKIRNRIWIISLVILISYIGTLIIDPTTWVTLLPIAVPAGILTFGIPAYGIVKYTKNSIGTCDINLDARVDALETNNSLAHKNNNKILSDPQYDSFDDCYEITQEKNKVKTKGTIR